MMNQMIQYFNRNLASLQEINARQPNALKEQENSKIFSSSFFYSRDFRKKISLLISNSKEFENPKSKIEFSVSSSEIKNRFANSNADFYFQVPPTKDPPLSSIKLKKKKDLVFLDLSSCFLSSSDTLKAFHKFSGLQYLCLSDCGIVDLTKTSDLINLPKTIRSLDLSRNFISQIPSEIHWKQIEYLNLSKNAFSKWPDAIEPEKLPNIISINLSENSILSHSSFASAFSKLQTLSLECNPHKTAPDWITKCTELKHVSFKGCSDLNLDLYSLFNLPNLVFLDISDVKITDVQRLKNLPRSLMLIICRRETKDYDTNFNLPIHNINDNLYNSYSKGTSVSSNDEFDYAVWDLG